jgi:hypothetical protein
VDIIHIESHTYPEPNFGPLIKLIATWGDEQLIDAAMYMGLTHTAAGDAHAYKHDFTRRTIYIFDELIGRYAGKFDEDPHIVPFGSPAAALEYWSTR